MLLDFDNYCWTCFIAVGPDFPTEVAVKAVKKIGQLTAEHI